MLHDIVEKLYKLIALFSVRSDILGHFFFAVVRDYRLLLN